MTNSPLALLQKLASRGTTVAAGTAAPYTAAAGPAAGLDFASLVTKAKAGQAVSDLPVTVSPRSGVELSPEQLQRLGAAADKAAAAGLQTALVLIDGKTLTLDVHKRQVTGAAQPTQQAITGIDGVVAVPDAGQEELGQEPQLLPLPRNGYDNSSLLSVLAAQQHGEAT
jgi:hypothetical protein